MQLVVDLHCTQSSAQRARRGPYGVRIGAVEGPAKCVSELHRFPYSLYRSYVGC